MRGEIAALARVSSTRGAPPSDRRDLHRPRADARVQRAAVAGAGGDDARAARCAKECRMRRWLIGLLVLALAGIVAGVSATVLARQGDPSPATGTADPASGPTPSPSPDPGATEPPSRGWPGSTPSGWPGPPAVRTSAPRLEVPLDYERPRAARSASAAQAAGVEPWRAGGVVGRQPGWSGCARDVVRRERDGRRSGTSSPTVSTWSGSTRAAPAGAARWTASTTPSSTPTSPGTPTRTPWPRCATFMAQVRGFGRGCSQRSADLVAPHLDRRGGPRHGRAAGGARGGRS